MVRRPRTLGRRLSQYAGPAALGAAWLLAAGAAAAIAYMQQASGTATALAVTRTHPLRAPESGWVVDVTVAPGTPVEAGAILARLEVPGMAQELAACEAEVRGAEESVLMDTADRDLKFARDIESTRRALLDAQVLLAGDRSALNQAQSEVLRQSAPGVVASDAVLTQAKQVEAGLIATLAARQGEVDALERAFSDARARAHTSFKGEAQLAAAVARRDAVLARAGSQELKAPTAGVVGPMVAAAGEWTTAGTPLLTITEAVSNEAVAYVPVSFARGLKVGGTVELMPQGGSTVQGTIAGIGPSVEQVPDALLPIAPTWAMPVHIRTDAVLVPGEKLGVEL